MMANQPNTHTAQKAVEIALALGVLIFLPAAWMMLLISESSETKAHRAVLGQLADLSSDYVLEINGRRVDRPDGIISDLKRIKRDHLKSNIANFPELYRVEIRDDQQAVSLLLTKDLSQNGRYWVFLPSRGNSLGTRIESFVDPDLAALLTAYQ